LAILPGTWMKRSDQLVLIDELGVGNYIRGQAAPLPAAMTVVHHLAQHCQLTSLPFGVCFPILFWGLPAVESAGTALAMVEQASWRAEVVRRASPRG
jgi:hypothetical protein